MKIKLKIRNYKLFKKRVDESCSNIKFAFFKSSGPGGQHRNKVETACRATDSITGFASEASDSKSQKANKSKAWTKLVQKIVKHFHDLDIEEGFSLEGIKDRIRTYHEKRNEAVDHRTGVIIPYNKALNGELENFNVLIDKRKIKND